MKTRIIVVLTLLACAFGNARAERRHGSPVVDLRSITTTPVVGRLYPIFEREAVYAGVSPITMYSIAWHETGGFKSPLWRRRNNPGGIGGQGHFKAYASEEAGIHGLAVCLAKSRYDRARRTSDPYQQVVAIGNGGYAEYSPSWPVKVKVYVRRFLARIQGRSV